MMTLIHDLLRRQSGKKAYLCKGIPRHPPGLQTNAGNVFFKAGRQTPPADDQNHRSEKQNAVELLNLMHWQYSDSFIWLGQWNPVHFSVPHNHHQTLKPSTNRQCGDAEEQREPKPCFQMREIWLNGPRLPLPQRGAV
jgi:hypothetical protein